MKKMNAATVSLMNDSFRKILFSNPVLVGGMVVGEIIIGATSLQNAIALSITFAIVTIPVLLLAPLIAYFVPKTWRILCYALVSMSMLFIGAGRGRHPSLRRSSIPSASICRCSRSTRSSSLFPPDLRGEGRRLQSVGRHLLQPRFLIVAVLIGGIRELFGTRHPLGI
jgi:hypothetical protein